MIILVGIVAIFILLIINFFLLAKGIPENIKSKIQNYSLIVALVSCFSTAPFVHRDIAGALLEAGYIRCEDYYRQRREEGSKSVFKKMAWVLDASDCTRVDAYPPAHNQ